MCDRINALLDTAALPAGTAWASHLVVDPADGAWLAAQGSDAGYRRGSLLAHRSASPIPAKVHQAGAGRNSRLGFVGVGPVLHRAVRQLRYPIYPLLSLGNTLNPKPVV